MGNNLRQARIAAGLNQTELAERMGTTQPRVSAIENAPNVEMSTVARYVEACGGTLEVSVQFPDERYVLGGENTWQRRE